MAATLEKYGRVIQLCVSITNSLFLLGGLLWAIAIWQRSGVEDRNTIQMQATEIAKLQAKITMLEAANQSTIGMVRDGQDKTSNRLTALETQNSFILQGLADLKSALSKRPL